MKVLGGCALVRETHPPLILVQWIVVRLEGVLQSELEVARVRCVRRKGASARDQTAIARYARIAGRTVSRRVESVEDIRPELEALFAEGWERLEE